MNWEMIFVGIGASISGTIVGSLLTAWLTHRFQARLLRQQLEAQRQSHAELLAFFDQALKDSHIRLRSLAKSLVSGLAALANTRS
jgi:hypothetical protein